MTDSISARLRKVCVATPAKIAWPHRILHEAADHIDALTALVAELEAQEKKSRGYRIGHIAGFHAGIRQAAERIDRRIKATQPEITRRAQQLAAAKQASVKYAISRAGLDARISDRDMVLALIDKGDSK